MLQPRQETEQRAWMHFVLSKPAPWHTKATLAEAKKRNSKSRYNRLWWGKWASGKGDALDEDEIDRCLKCHPGPLSKPEKGWTYIAGLDLGISHDHAAWVIVGVNQRLQRMRIAQVKAWVPQEDTGEVDLIDVQETVQKDYTFWKLYYVGHDPYECRLMAQQLKRRGVPMREMTFSSPKNLTTMASCLVQAISGRALQDPRKQKESGNKKQAVKADDKEFVLSSTLEGFEDEEGRLRRDFGRLNIVEKTFSYKIEAVSDENGHADVGIALAIVLPRAIDMLAGHGGLEADDDIAFGDDMIELTAEEVDAMPDDLRDLYGDDFGGPGGGYTDTRPRSHHPRQQEADPDDPFADLQGFDQRDELDDD